MMYFENPLYLHLGWSVPLLILLYIMYRYRQAKAKNRLGEEIFVQRLILNSSKGRATSKFLLMLLAYCCFIIALAKPVTAEQEMTSLATEQADIVFAIDVSNSMLVADVLPDRLTLAKKFVSEVIERLNGAQVGIVVFAKKAYPYLPLTTNYKTVQEAGKIITPDMIATQGTSLREALKMAAMLLQSRENKARVICVLSDGESHQENYESLSDSLSKAGIHIFAFGLGTEAGNYVPIRQQNGTIYTKKDARGIPVISRIQEESLLKITGNKHNRYARLQPGEQSVTLLLNEIYKLPKGNAVSKAKSKEYFQHFLLAGLFLLFLEMLIYSGNNSAHIRETQV
jgi:Ca-activated chloride channel homolog